MLLHRPNSVALFLDAMNVRRGGELMGFDMLLWIHKYGAKTEEAVFKIRQAPNLKNAIKPSLMSKTAIRTAAKQKKKGKKF